MSDIIYDGDFSTAQQCSGARFSAPIEGINADYLLEQDFMQAEADYAPLALDTAHPDYPDYKLVSEGPKENMGAGILKWTRVYAKVPDTHYDYQKLAYSFIGFDITVEDNFVVEGRQRVNRTVVAQVKYEYFLTSAPDDIVRTPATRYYLDTDAMQDFDFLNTPPTAAVQTVPTRTTYETWITDAESNGWDATDGKLVAEDADVERWMGNIWRRVTRYVLAQ